MDPITIGIGISLVAGGGGIGTLVDRAKRKQPKRHGSFKRTQHTPCDKHKALGVQSCDCYMRGEPGWYWNRALDQWCRSPHDKVPQDEREDHELSILRDATVRGLSVAILETYTEKVLAGKTVRECLADDFAQMGVAGRDVLDGLRESLGPLKDHFPTGPKSGAGPCAERGHDWTAPVTANPRGKVYCARCGVKRPRQCRCVPTGGPNCRICFPTERLEAPRTLSCGCSELSVNSKCRHVRGEGLTFYTEDGSVMRFPAANILSIEEQYSARTRGKWLKVIERSGRSYERLYSTAKDARRARERGTWRDPDYSSQMARAAEIHASRINAAKITSYDPGVEAEYQAAKRQIESLKDTIAKLRS